MINVVVFLVALFIYPLAYGLGLSFQPLKSTDPLYNYKQFFTDHLQRDTIGTTLRISLPAALVNVIASVPIAYRMRGRMRGKRFITTMLVIPITLGTVLTADGMLKFFDPAGGWFNKTLFFLHVRTPDHPVQLINNYWGVVISLVISGFPFAFLLILSYLSGFAKRLSLLVAYRFRRYNNNVSDPAICFFHLLQKTLLVERVFGD